MHMGFGEERGVVEMGTILLKAHPRSRRSKYFGMIDPSGFIIIINEFTAAAPF